MIELEDIEYSEGWVFFVSDNKEVSLLKLNSIEWCLGWLAAYADYGCSDMEGYQTIEECVFNEYEKSEVAQQFVEQCKNAVAWVKQQDNFFRLPTVEF